MRKLRFIILVLAVLAAVVSPAAEDRIQSRPSFERVPVDPAMIDVGDGDTVTIHWGEGDDERIRILGIDTPEIAHHSMGWYDDQPYRFRRRMRELNDWREGKREKADQD